MQRMGWQTANYRDEYLFSLVRLVTARQILLDELCFSLRIV